PDTVCSRAYGPLRRTRLSQAEHREHTACVGVHMSDARGWVFGVCAMFCAACGGGGDDRPSSAEPRDAGVEPMDAAEPQPWSIDGGTTAQRDSAPSQRVQRDASAPMAYDAGPQQPVTIRFRAKIFEREFQCGERYPRMGKSGVTVEPADLRFFVQ